MTTTALLTSDLLALPIEGEQAIATLPGGELGVWETGPGTQSDTEVDEVFVVLAGEATVEVAGGPTFEIRPGSVVRLYAGDRTTWTVRETLRKLYVALDEPVEGEPGERVLAEDLRTVPLTGESAPGSWVEGGWPVAHTRPLGDLAGVRLSAWEVTAGVVADLEQDEYLLVLSGVAVVRIEGGPAVELSPHALLRLGEGDRTEWTVTEDVRAFLVSLPA
jgi:uncharacterized cupin superfamily protein